MIDKEVKEIKVENYEFHPDPKRPNLVDRFGVSITLENKVSLYLTPVQAGQLLRELDIKVKAMMSRFGIDSL
ncbi:MAG: hypothetical protein MJZ66_04115 [Bacteroidales bacterium]|nr:hypothetical protein [Bacteroidales bacterium]